MKTVEVHVTAEHIANGEATNCVRCPIALALRDIYPSHAVIDAWAMCAFIDLPGSGLMLTFPPEAEAFVDAFDAGRPVTPFTFTAEQVTA